VNRAKLRVADEGVELLQAHRLVGVAVLELALIQILRGRL